MRVLSLISALVVLVAGCSGERVVTTDEPWVPSPVTTTGGPPAPPADPAHLVDAFAYVAHPAGEAIYYFTTPSGRWSCAIVPRVEAGCQSTANWKAGLGITGEPDTVPNGRGEETPPNAVVVERDADPRFVALAGPDLILDSAKTLQFNRILNVAGFRCNIQEASGVSCMSEATGKGFTFAADGVVPRYTEVPPSAP